MVRSAVERQLAIIGEALSRLADLTLREDDPWLIGCRIDKEKPADIMERDPPRIRDQFVRGLGVKK